MSKPTSVVRPEIRRENRHSINSMLRRSYSEAKKQIQDGLNAIKDEVRNTADACLDLFSMPVNNHLKDNSQIDQDFLPSREGPPSESSSMRIIAITEALSASGPMEENY
jgi:hypothetical protein